MKHLLSLCFPLLLPSSFAVLFFPTTTSTRVFVFLVFFRHPIQTKRMTSDDNDERHGNRDSHDTGMKNICKKMRESAYLYLYLSISCIVEETTVLYFID